MARHRVEPDAEPAGPPPIEKIRRLIALTSSNFTEEARSSALIACRLIREHELVLVDPKSQPAPAPHSRPSSGDRQDDFDPSPRPPRRSTRRGNGPISIDNTYPTSRCLECDELIELGERCWWRPGKGCTHQRCEGKWRGSE